MNPRRPWRRRPKLRRSLRRRLSQKEEKEVDLSRITKNWVKRSKRLIAEEKRKHNLNSVEGRREFADNILIGAFSGIRQSIIGKLPVNKRKQINSEMRKTEEVYIKAFNIYSSYSSRNPDSLDRNALRNLVKSVSRIQDMNKKEGISTVENLEEILMKGPSEKRFLNVIFRALRKRTIFLLGEHSYEYAVARDAAVDEVMSFLKKKSGKRFTQTKRSLRLKTTAFWKSNVKSIIEKEAGKRKLDTASKRLNFANAVAVEAVGRMRDSLIESMNSIEPLKPESEETLRNDLQRIDSAWLTAQNFAFSNDKRFKSMSASAESFSKRKEKEVRKNFTGLLNELTEAGIEFPRDFNEILEGEKTGRDFFMVINNILRLRTSLAILDAYEGTENAERIIELGEKRFRNIKIIFDELNNFFKR